MPRTKWVLMVALAMLAVGAGVLTLGLARSFEPTPAQTTSAGAPIGGPFTLAATTGGTVTDQTYRGKWMVIYFGYTFCPDACPTALTNLSDALARLGPDAAKMQPLFVTVDPKRDTVEVMSDYIKSFDHRIIGLTGTQAQIARVAKEYHVYVAPQSTGGTDYLVDHSAYFYVVNPAGKFVNVLAGDLTGDRLASHLRDLIDHATS